MTNSDAFWLLYIMNFCCVAGSGHPPTLCYCSLLRLQCFTKRGILKSVWFHKNLSMYVPGVCHWWRSQQPSVQFWVSSRFDQHSWVITGWWHRFWISERLLLMFFSNHGTQIDVITQLNSEHWLWLWILSEAERENDY